MIGDSSHKPPFKNIFGSSGERPADLHQNKKQRLSTYLYRPWQERLAGLLRVTPEPSYGHDILGNYVIRPGLLKF